MEDGNFITWVGREKRNKNEGNSSAYKVDRKSRERNTEKRGERVRTREKIRQHGRKVTSWKTFQVTGRPEDV